MKWGRGLALATLTLAITTTGCKKDEETPTPTPTPKKSELVIDGVAGAVNSAILLYYGDITMTGTENFDLIITTGSLAVTANGATGTGDYLYAELFTNIATHLNAGDYNWIPEADYGTAFSFTIGSFVKNFDAAAETSDYDEEFKAGKIDVKHTAGTTATNGVYEFTFDVTLENNKKVTGYYKGQVTFIDESRVGRTEATKGGNLFREFAN